MSIRKLNCPSILVTMMLWWSGGNFISAENLFLRSGATGNASGADWNDAWSSVEKIKWGEGVGQLGNGDTLWIASGRYEPIDLAAKGNYSGQTFLRRAKKDNLACTSVSGWQRTFDDRVWIELLNDDQALTTFEIDFHNLWYVDRGAAGFATGDSWETAWSNTSEINWKVIQAGDTINLSGGIVGKTYSTFTTSKGGKAGRPLLIRRSNESGHDGPVSITSAPISIRGPYTIMDGGQPEKFLVNVISATNFAARGSINVAEEADYFELRNASIVGDFTGGFGHSVGIAAAHATISNCRFIKSVYEDMLNFTGDGGALIIENSLFQDNVNNDSVHRDVMNPYVSGGYDLTIRGNMFVNAGDVFLIQNPTPLGKVRVVYNLFFNTARAIAFGTGNQGATEVNAYNNVYYNVSDSVQGFPSAIYTNNLKKLTAQSNIVRDNGSVITNVFWLDPTKPLGLDGIPFTADDGFNLTSGSAAINAGAAIGETADIRMNPLVGLPDLGAYEFQGN